MGTEADETPPTRGIDHRSPDNDNRWLEFTSYAGQPFVATAESFGPATKHGPEITAPAGEKPANLHTKGTMTRDDSQLDTKPTPDADLAWLDVESAKPARAAPKKRKKAKRAKKREKVAIREDLDVESGVKLTDEQKRARTMAKQLVGKSRTWASDGEYVYFRRKQANPATLERHERFLQTGDYRHVATEDDVEVYELQEGSPFKRHNGGNLLEADIVGLRRHAVLAACKYDFKLYVDILEEIAGRLKGAFHPEEAKVQYEEMLGYILHLINLRGGPSEVQLNRGVISTRQARGQHRSRLVMLPPGMKAH